MNDWTGGYVADVPYLDSFQPVQVPANLDLACLMTGCMPARMPGAAGGFTYCDLGCGMGVTVAALAAATPEARFWGIDLMPAHIARAEGFRRAAGLENLTLLEADVRQLVDDPDPGLPQFDYIALHGLYSWVSEPVRQAILAFLERFLRPGGLVYLGYNVLPGWIDTVPMQKLMQEYAALQPGPSTARAAAAFDFVAQFAEAGGKALDSDIRKRPLGGGGPDGMARRNRYLAHEFLNTSWQPRFHVDVAREMATARLDFAGSAQLVENFEGIGIPRAAQALLETVPSGPLRETLADYCHMRGFRRDVFVRGRREMLPEQREKAMGDVVLALRQPRPDPARRKWEVMAEDFALDPGVYGPVLDVLERGPAPVSALCAAVAASGREVSANELVGLLVGLELVLPVLHDVPTTALAGCARHNGVVMDEAFRSVRAYTFAVAVPVGHTGLTLTAMELLLLEGLREGLPPEAAPLTAHVLARLGLEADAPVPPEALTGAGEAVMQAASAGDADAGATTGRLGETVRVAIAERLAQYLPIWVRLGLVPPPEGG